MNGIGEGIAHLVNPDLLVEIERNVSKIGSSVNEVR